MADELKAKLEKYFKNAEGMFEGVRACGVVDVESGAVGRKILESALNYYSDAKHFYGKGEYVNALAALEYAEGWLDAGKAAGFLEPAASSARRRLP